MKKSSKISYIITFIGFLPIIFVLLFLYLYIDSLVDLRISLSNKDAQPAEKILYDTVYVKCTRNHCDEHKEARAQILSLGRDTVNKVFRKDSVNKSKSTLKNVKSSLDSSSETQPPTNQ